MHHNVFLKIVSTDEAKKIHKVYDLISHRSYNITLNDIVAYGSDWGYGQQILLNKKIHRAYRYEDSYSLVVSVNTLKKLGLVLPTQIS